MTRRLSAELTTLGVVEVIMAPLQPGSGGFPAETLFLDDLMLTSLFPLFPLVVLHGGILRLHRRGSVSGPTGSYCCVIPDNTGVNMTFCVRIGECILFCTYLLLFSVTEVITASPLTTSKDIGREGLATVENLKLSVTRYVIGMHHFASTFVASKLWQ